MDHENFTYDKHQATMHDHCIYRWCLTNKKTGCSVSFSGLGYFVEREKYNHHTNRFGFMANGFRFRHVSDDYGTQDGISRWAMEVLKDVQGNGSDDWLVWEKIDEVYNFVFVKYSKDKEEIK